MMKQFALGASLAALLTGCSGGTSTNQSQAAANGAMEAVPANVSAPVEIGNGTALTDPGGGNTSIAGEPAQADAAAAQQPFRPTPLRRPPGPPLGGTLGGTLNRIPVEPRREFAPAPDMRPAPRVKPAPPPAPRPAQKQEPVDPHAGHDMSTMNHQ